MKKFKNVTFIFIGILFFNLIALANDFPKDSLYQLQGHWKNQEAQDAAFKTFAGEPVVMAMTYTGCQYSCPMTLNKLSEIEKSLQKSGVRHYRFVVASFDAEKDKPEVLKAYIQKRKIDSTHWTFLSAQSDRDVRELAVLLSVNYQKLDNGDFSHSNTISLLDPQGRLSLQLKGLASSHEELVNKVVSYEKQNSN